MEKSCSIMGRARDELGAAMSLADDYPLQAMELLSSSVRTAVQAVTAGEFDFERGTPLDRMIGVVPQDVFETVTSARLAAVVRSCDAWAERGVEGDFLTALRADMQVAADFIHDAEEWVMHSSQREAAFA